MRPVLCALLLHGVAGQAAPPPLPSLAGEWQVTRICAAAATAAREACAGPGVTAASCAEAGCCWDSTNVSLPWCFLPNAPASWDAPGPLTAYGANQAAPATSSRRGGVRASISGDVAAVSCALLPPFVGECDYSYGDPTPPGYGFPHNFSVNGVRPTALPRFRWAPYGFSRGAVDTGGVQVTSEVRLLHSEAVVLVQVSVGSLPVGAPATVSLLLPLLFRDFGAAPPGSWGWPHPQQAANLWEVGHALRGGGVVLATDTLSPAVAAAAVWSDTGAPAAVALAPLDGSPVGAASWSFTPATQTPATFGVLVYIGRNASNATAAAGLLGGDSFPASWARAAGEWDALWMDAFTPPSGGGNSSKGTFSGSLPVLAAGQPANCTPAMARVYYQGVVTALSLWKHPPMVPADEAPSSAPPYPLPLGFAATAGVQWAVTTTYFWDIAYAGPLLYALEPLGMRAMLEALLSIDFHSHYALDALAMAGVGPWYAFNDWSIYLILRGWAGTVTPGGGAEATAFWLAPIAGRRAIDWLDGVATAWQALPAIATARGALADYGLADNLLECVPSYLHGVPSLNAANIAMMRGAAGVWESLGSSSNATRAAELRAGAAALLPAVLDLYVPGQGFWACAYPNSTTVPVRHVVDFFTTAEALAGDLTPGTRAEMAAFVAGSLLTPGWMRALALDDPVAPLSDRADHGPWGAYDGWPSKTIDAFMALGLPDAARAMFDRILPAVVQEGPLGQSHRVYNNSLLPGLLTAKATTDQQYYEIIGAAMGVTVMRMVGALPGLPYGSSP